MENPRRPIGTFPLVYLLGLVLLAAGVAATLLLLPLPGAARQRDLLMLAGVVAYGALAVSWLLSPRRKSVWMIRTVAFGNLLLVAPCEYFLRPAAASIWLLYPLNIAFAAFASDRLTTWPAVALASLMDGIVTLAAAGTQTPFAWVDFGTRVLIYLAAGLLMTRGALLATRVWKDALETERKYSGEILRLSNLGRPLAEALTYDQLRDRLPSLLRRAVPAAQAGALFLLDAPKRTLQPLAFFGYRELLREARFPTTKNLVGEAFQSDSPRLLPVEDLPSSPDGENEDDLFSYLESGAEVRPRSVILAPVRVGQAARAALILSAGALGKFSARELDITRAIASNLGTVLEHLDANEVLRQVAQQREVLLRITHEAASATDLEQVYRALYDGTRTLMSADSFVIALYEEGSAQAHLVYVVDEGQRSPPIAVSAEEGMLGHMRSLRQPFRVDDLANPLPYVPRYYGGVEPVRSALCAPLRVGDRLIGMISAQSLRPAAYLEEDLRLFTALAESAGAIVEHMHHLERERRRAQQFEGLAHNLVHLLTRGPLTGAEDSRSYLLQQVTRMLCEYLDASLCTTLILTDDQQGFQVEAVVSPHPGQEAFPPGAQIALDQVPGLAEVLHRGSAAVWRLDQESTPSLADQVRAISSRPISSLAILPMIAPTRHWGVVLLAQERSWEEAPFTPDQLRLVEIIVHQIAILLENQAATQAAAQRLNSLTRLYELELSLAAASDPVRVLELTLDVAIEALWASGGSIALWDEEHQALDNVISRSAPASVAAAPFRPDGFAMTTFRKGEARYVSNLQGEDDGRPLVDPSGIRAAAHLPLRTDGPPFGILVLDFHHPREFPEQDRRLLEMFAARAALAYEKARLLRALQEAHERFERTVQHVPGAIYRGDVNGTTTFISQGIRDLTGFAPEEWINTPNILSERLHPDDRERVRASFGTAISQGKDWSEEYRLLDRQDRPRWIRDVARMVHEPDGTIRYYDGVMTDITTRRELEERLLRSARLESATALGMGLAHEINNALSTLSLHSYLLSRRTPPDNEEVTHHLQVIEQTVQRTAGLIQHFRDLAQPTPTTVAPVSVSSLLEEVLVTHGERIREQEIRLDLTLSPDLARIHGDRTALYEAFSAVIKNAIEACGPSGVLTVSAREGTLRREGGELPAIAVEVRDTGSGINEEDLPRVFEPGFTRKVERGTVRGLGFGLAIAQQIIAAHSGEIEVQSRAGAGTTVRILLPTESDT